MVEAEVAFIENVEDLMAVGTGLSSAIKHLLEVWWVVGSIPCGGPIKLFLVPASIPQLVY